jgi:hypothetical protein
LAMKRCSPKTGSPSQKKSDPCRTSVR